MPTQSVRWDSSTNVFPKGDASGKPWRSPRATRCSRKSGAAWRLNGGDSADISSDGTIAQLGAGPGGRDLSNQDSRSGVRCQVLLHVLRSESVQDTRQLLTFAICVGSPTIGDLGRDDILLRSRIALRRTVPHAAPVRRDVDLGGIEGVGNDAVAPLEVEPPDAAPGLAPIV